MKTLVAQDIEAYAQAHSMPESDVARALREETRRTMDYAQMMGRCRDARTGVTPVLKALRTHGIDVAAIHHHMTGVMPMVVFLHYLGPGRADTLAGAVRAAVDQPGKSVPAHR